METLKKMNLKELDSVNDLKKMNFTELEPSEMKQVQGGSAISEIFNRLTDQATTLVNGVISKLP